MAMDWSPDEQKRLIVIAEVSTGSPARIAAARATFIPCSASGIAQPMITSSISDFSNPSARRTASFDDGRAHLVGPRVLQSPLRGLADRRAHGGNDDCVSHDSSVSVDSRQ